MRSLVCFSKQKLQSNSCLDYAACLSSVKTEDWLAVKVSNSPNNFQYFPVVSDCESTISSAFSNL